MEFGVRHYPQLEIDLDKLEDNLRALKSRMDASGIRLAGVVKGFNGLPQAAKVYEKAGYSSIASSRLEQLHHLRMNGIAVPLMLIRIPMLSEVEETARWTDISLHSEPEVLRAMERAVKAAAALPLERILLETDCPYMAPEPCRGRRCDSGLIAHTGEFLAEVRGVDPDVIFAATTENAKRLFGI
mgnify:CR=1 FL=1